MGELVFDPNLPAEHSPISSAELRTQFQALQFEIDARATNDQLNDVSTNLLADLDQKASTAALTDGLNTLTAQTPNNVDGVDALALTVSDPPTQAEMQAVVDRLNDLITGLHRGP